MIPALCLLTGVASANECKYTTDVDTSFEGVISKSQNYDKKTYPHIEDTRKCVVNLDVEIENKWHPTSGSYIFGPDVSENEACKNAEMVAKENILRTTVPEKLNKKMEQNCKVSVGEVSSKPVEPPPPLAVPTIPVQQVPVGNVFPMINPPMPPMAYNPYLLPDTLPVCKRVNMVVLIDGRQQLVWKEYCQ